MSNNSPSIDELRESFERVYHGPDSLRREYDLQNEARRMGIPLDDYRRLYELRSSEEIDPYPKSKHWWHTPGDWSKWVWHLPTKKKLALSRKGALKLVQSGLILTIAIGIGRYVWEAPKREKATHYQAWQMINSATGQKTSGGRIEALQDLNKDGVDLRGLDASNANLSGAILTGAQLSGANLSNAELVGAELNGANLYSTKLTGIQLNGANLSNAELMSAELNGADLGEAKLIGAILMGSDLRDTELAGANLRNAEFACNLDCTNLKGAKNITPEQIKEAENWQSACYDPDFRIKLGLSAQNPPDCAGEKPTK
ncbi:hypothetical protein RIVM261_078690 [Rivularia sp. IAM M-261]|nr:hypothetical protein RIVM261_078690 [Rivularia sp. IAM M-261]